MGVQSGIAVELVGGGAETPFQCGGLGVLFGWGDPEHILVVCARRVLHSFSAATPKRQVS